MHTSVVTDQVFSSPSGSRRQQHQQNFGADTFAASEKTAIENEDNMGYDMYKNENYYGNPKASLRSDGFMRLESTDDPDPPVPPPAQAASSAAPYLQPPVVIDNRRNFGMRLLLGPARRPWFSWLTGLAMLIVLIVEFVKNYQLTGSVIATTSNSPSFNVMIGPTFTVLINMGARFTPCIRNVPKYSADTMFSYCYRSESDTCSLESLCGFGGFGSSGEPDQSFRFVTPIFMHAGIVHYVINMLGHLRLGADLECLLGIPRYVLLYMASGIYGFVLSAMLSQATTATTGCSGALFGLIGYMFIDVLVNWKTNPNPIRELMQLLITTVISLVLGLLPGLDNFAHLGKF